MKTGQFILLILLVASLFSIVTSQHASRKLFVEIERADALTYRLDTDYRQLQVEQTSLSKPALIDEAARRNLAMERVTPARTIYITQPSVASEGAAQ